MSGQDDGKVATRSHVMLGLLSLAYLMSVADRAVLGLLVEPIKASLQLTDTQISLLQGLAFLLIYAVAGIPFGWLADRANRVKMISGAIAFWSVMTASCGFASGLWSLFFFRAAVGVGEAALSPGAMSLISEAYPRRRLGLALAVYGLGGSIGSGAAMVAGGIIYDRLLASGGLALPLVGRLEPWQGTFVLIALPGLLVAFALSRLRDPRANAGAGPAAPAPRASPIGAFYRQNWVTLAGLHIGVAGAMSAMLVLLSWGAPLFTRVHGWSVAQAGVMLGGVIIPATVLGQLLGGYLSDRLSRWRAPGRVIPAAAAAPIALGAAFYFALTPLASGALAAYAALMFLVPLVSGVALSALQDFTPPGNRGRVTAILLVFNSVVTAFAPTVVGLLNDNVFVEADGARWSMMVCCGFALSAAAIGLATAARSYRFATDVAVAPAAAPARS